MSAEFATLEELRKDHERFEWFFGQADKGPFIQTYLYGVRDNFTVDQWRSAIDEAMNQPAK